MSTGVTTLAGPELAALMRTFRDGLAEYRPYLNELNVYPVPDGDTGTNMMLTIESVCAEVDAVDATDLDAVLGAIAHGSLMGARGNSGVIMSQVLRGLASELAGVDQVGAKLLADGLTTAAEKAYEAVMRPVEGTILTVVRRSADAARVAADDGADLIATMEATLAAAEDALARTPELLPVLAEAGVVDSGAAGFVVFVHSMLHVADGRAVPDAPETVSAPDVDVLAVADAAGDVSELRYEVMFFLDAPDESIDGFKSAWAELGDSIVVIGGDGVWNCHIHTDDIGGSIEAGIDVGRPHTIRVTDLLEEVEERGWVADALDADEDLDELHCSVVAVAVGDGIDEIFRSLGAQAIIKGGQTMNPSTKELLAAVERIPASQVVILPNNKNIIAVAEQVDAQTEKSVAVVGTTSVVEGFAALVAYDPEGQADANATSMAAAADHVVTGEVTRAVRESTWEGGDVGKGDWMGMGPGGIRAVADNAIDAATVLLDHLVDTAEHEIVTVIVGRDGEEPTTAAITEWLAEHRPDVEVEVHLGGQPLYPYYFGIE